MTVEAATFVADLQPVNPPATDLRSEGDNHLRLIKQVLQNTFGGASRQFQIPGAVSISSSTSVTKANGESTLYISTSGGVVTLTLPTLTAIDAGWKVRICKTSSDANPIFVVPFSGAINSGGLSGLTKARRCIPGVMFETIWDGSNWFVTRALALPIGSCIEFHGSSLPAGYEWPNGQTLSSAANYPEYNAAMGALTTLDKRGRVGVPLDNLGGTDSGRLNVTGCGLQGVRITLGGTGGTSATTLVSGNLPPYTPTGTIAGTVTVTSLSMSASPNNVGTGAPFTDIISSGSTPITATFSGTFTGTPAAGQISTPFNNVPVSIMVNQILVVE